MSIQYYVTPFLNGMFQHETNKFLAHTYTRQSQTPLPGDQTDDWGQPITTPSPEVPGQPCFYTVEHGPVVRSSGVISLNIPVLTVPSNDPLKEGDLVSNIMTRSDLKSGTAAVLLLEGPVEVEAINDRAPGYGGVILKQAILREVQVVGSA